MIDRERMYEAAYNALVELSPELLDSIVDNSFSPDERRDVERLSTLKESHAASCEYEKAAEVRSQIDSINKGVRERMRKTIPEEFRNVLVGAVEKVLGLYNLSD